MIGSEDQVYMDTLRIGSYYRNEHGTRVGPVNPTVGSTNGHAAITQFLPTQTVIPGKLYCTRLCLHWAKVMRHTMRGMQFKKIKQKRKVVAKKLKSISKIQKVYYLTKYVCLCV